MDLGAFMKTLAEQVGGNYSIFNNLSIIEYPLKNGQTQSVFGTNLKGKEFNMIGFTSAVGKCGDLTDFKELLEFSHHQCYTKVTVAGDNIFVAAVTIEHYTSEAQLGDMIFEVARVANQLETILATKYQSN
jgi:hypothetical protein